MFSLNQKQVKDLGLGFNRFPVPEDILEEEEICPGRKLLVVVALR